MTIEIAKALLAVGKAAAAEKIHSAVIAGILAWGKRYLHAGYSGCFGYWLMDKYPKP